MPTCQECRDLKNRIASLIADLRQNAQKALALAVDPRADRQIHLDQTQEEGKSLQARLKTMRECLEFHRANHGSKDGSELIGLLV